MLSKADIPVRNPNAGIKWFNETRIPLSVPVPYGLEVRYTRSCPVICSNLNWQQSKKENLAKEMTAARLGNSESNVRDVIKELESGERVRRCTTTKLQKHLASIFMDLASEKPEPETRNLQAKVLNALCQSKYPYLMIYYLMQTVHSVENPIALGKYNPAEVEKLCQATSTDYADGPFTGILPGD